MNLPLLAFLILTPQLCIADFQIAVPVSGDFPIFRTPSPADERAFSSSAGAASPGPLGYIDAVGYADNVGGIPVSFGGSMTALSGSASGSAAGGRHGSGSTAGSSGADGFGLALGMGMGADFGDHQLSAGGGASGTTGHAAFSAHGGRGSVSEAAHRGRRTRGAARAHAGPQLAGAQALQGNAKKSVNTTAAESSGTVTDAGAGAVVASCTGAGAVSTGVGGGDARVKDRAKQKIGTTGAGAGAAGVSAGNGRRSGRGASTAMVRGGSVNGTSAARAEPGRKGAGAAAVTTGQGAAQAIGEGSGLVRMLPGMGLGKGRRSHPKFVRW